MSTDHDVIVEGVRCVAISSQLRGMLGLVCHMEEQLNEILDADPDLAPEIEAMRTHFVEGMEAGQRLMRFLTARFEEMQ